MCLVSVNAGQAQIVFIHVHVHKMSILSGAKVQKHNVDIVK